jgi:hypothetical protein
MPPFAANVCGIVQRSKLLKQKTAPPAPVRFESIVMRR